MFAIVEADGELRRWVAGREGVDCRSRDVRTVKSTSLSECGAKELDRGDASPA
jgi:hypothetical protein